MHIYDALKPLLFTFPPETAHGLSLKLMHLAGSNPMLRALLFAQFGYSASAPVQAFGLTFPNRIGLAAGYDKDGLGWRGLASLGFGHVEVGTVTPKAQAGNPTPRVFRLPDDASLINRLGFPGHGSERVLARLGTDRPHGVVLGVNIGKNKDTPLTDAVDDYTMLIERMAPVADYLAINVSSPNTVGLRDLQGPVALDALLGELVLARNKARDRVGRPLPLLIKLAPDLDDAGLDAALDVILARGLDGIIATNTTIRRDGLRSSHANEKGGLSGAALTDLSTEMIRKIHTRTSGALPIVGVGGVMNASDARAKLDAGAILVQLYTGMIYQGPGLAKAILRSL